MKILKDNNRLARIYAVILSRKNKSERNFLIKHERFMRKMRNINEINVKSEGRVNRRIQKY